LPIHETLLRGYRNSFMAKPIQQSYITMFSTIIKPNSWIDERIDALGIVIFFFQSL